VLCFGRDCQTQAEYFPGGGTSDNDLTSIAVPSATRGDAGTVQAKENGQLGTCIDRSRFVETSMIEAPKGQ